MSRAAELLADLTRRGISVVVEGARLRVAPRSALDRALIERILECKHELFAARGGPPGAPPVERWLLWTLAAAPGLTRAALQSQVERALAALLERGEVRCRDGRLTLNSQ